MADSCRAVRSKAPSKWLASSPIVPGERFASSTPRRLMNSMRSTRERSCPMILRIIGLETNAPSLLRAGHCFTLKVARVAGKFLDPELAHDWVGEFRNYFGAESFIGQE